MGMEHKFRKMASVNQGTPYNYNSVMQYHRYDFSKNNQPTMVPILNSSVSFGNANEMSCNDITRVTVTKESRPDVLTDTSPSDHWPTEAADMNSSAQQPMIF
uniref:astacin-like metalloendopeptidase n=1 Tax=Monopterus albus TaxID=43700 RepID=UPI0009B46E83|nr:astacin-like metalloendopeptidase [Monopterus albus]